MDEDIKSLTKQIAENINPMKLVLFGSRVSGKTGPDSDIDLCVIEDSVKDKSEEFIRIRKVMGNFIQPVDLLIFNRDEFDRRKNIWGTVQYEIDKKGLVLYERRD